MQPELKHAQDYRDYLRGVLEHRIRVNARYSLRAFARDLHVSPQMLSFVLNRKKGFSPTAAVTVAERLDLTPAETARFLDLVGISRARSPRAREILQHRLKGSTSTLPAYQAMAMEAFQVISDWHHIALMELTFVEGFRADPRWVAARLAVTRFEAEQALERLVRLGFLVRDSRGKVKKREGNLNVPHGVPSTAARKLARQLLTKAIQSLETQTMDERDLTNITMAIDPARLPEAKKRIAKFRRQLCAFLEQGRRTEVYTFAPSLFRITQPYSPRLKEKLR